MNKERTLEQIRSDGLDALLRELGPVGMIRFMQQFDSGWGDFTAERDQGEGDVRELADEIMRWRREKAVYKAQE